MPHSTYTGTGTFSSFILNNVTSPNTLVHSDYRLTCFAYNECGDEVSFYQDFEVIKPSPFNEELEDALTKDNQNQFSIFPNPVKNNLQIKALNGVNRVEIYSLSGTLISVHKSTSINVSELPSGVYIARIFESEKYFENTKFIKQ